jgi:hypothetical protein
LLVLVVQVLTVRRRVLQTSVSVAFLVVWWPYFWFACPQSHVESSAASVGGRILNDLRIGALDAAADRFCNNEMRQRFLDTVGKSRLLGLREWIPTRTQRIWHEQGCAEFHVVRSDGEPAHVEVEVWTQYFGWPVAANFDVTEK